LGAEPVMQIGGVDMGEQRETGRIDENMPLPAEGALRGVVAARWAADTGRPHGLAVDDGGRRLRMSSFGFAREGAKPIVQAPERSVQPPAPEMREDRGPRREGGREHAPGTARTDEIEDRLDHQPPRPFERPPSCRWRREQRLQCCPLSVREVRRIPMLTGFAHCCLGLKNEPQQRFKPQSAFPHSQ
jgi:hypothetical protein